MRRIRNLLLIINLHGIHAPLPRLNQPHGSIGTLANNSPNSIGPNKLRILVGNILFRFNTLESLGRCLFDHFVVYFWKQFCFLLLCQCRFLGGESWENFVAISGVLFVFLQAQEFLLSIIQLLTTSVQDSFLQVRKFHRTPELNPKCPTAPRILSPPMWIKFNSLKLLPLFHK